MDGATKAVIPIPQLSAHYAVSQVEMAATCQRRHVSPSVALEDTRSLEPSILTNAVSYNLELMLGIERF